LDISEFCRVERWLLTQRGRHQETIRMTFWQFRSAQKPVAEHRLIVRSAPILLQKSKIEQL